MYTDMYCIQIRTCILNSTVYMHVLYIHFMYIYSVFISLQYFYCLFTACRWSLVSRMYLSMYSCVSTLRSMKNRNHIACICTHTWSVKPSLIQISQWIHLNVCLTSERYSAVTVKLKATHVKVLHSKLNLM